ncbi:MAG: murein biosynthesis integral membrane protein MurJ [Candidatus Nealsonbacteria bacterium CG23_combo_of_CG06-09_8_20_14_all_36_12]|uniref:Probable lipid II flippase MurJ n=2 Tax=Candidatus Nealsoniibacteriota TaxID=1817911 RepID=A0A2H0TL80_9BACT|nr:MAG: murein biosynthesis integral membrane protein MurJ [Candidatus Nealsonbacteria bacterium CG23_combo_of_CG06-09_8_20_14_all_36_12]PIR72910.1 MAG: murein biosynthesis integral membrane protein MurJ [Candidatus Nealsonbacteria bacterium CG10_big_fil_rev_8_21_14_0_10_36_23]
MVLTKIFNFQTKTITFGALILGASYFFSAILGLLRDRLLAGHFGAGLELDVYFAVFRIPDFVYNILILGGLIVAFLPLFSEYFAKNKEEAWEMTNHILNVLLFFLILISLILFILTPWLIKLIFPGFGSEEIKLAIPLTRLLFLSPIFFGISNLLSGILQYFNRFFVYSLTPILYNLGIIFGILFLAPKFGIFGVGIGVILGAFCHMAIQIPSAKNCGFSYKFFFNLKYPALKRIFHLMIPRVFGVAAQQINLIVITAIASMISAGSIAIFNFSNNLQSLPIGIIGASFAVVIFPVLSKAWAQNQREEFLKNFSTVFRQTLFLIIPISLLIFIFRTQIVKIILETGQFSALDTKLTAVCLGLFAFSIFAQSLIPLLARAFFSFQDTKTPTLIAIFAFTLNIILSLSFVWLLGFPNLFSNFIESSFGLINVENIAITGLPIAFSIAAIFQFILLFTLFRRKIRKIS